MNIKLMELSVKKKFDREPVVYSCIGFRTSYLPDGISLEIYGVDSAGYMDVVAMTTCVDSFTIKKPE